MYHGYNVCIQYGVGHDHVYHEALLEIIILKAVELPTDSDVLYVQG